MTDLAVAMTGIAVADLLFQDVRASRNRHGPEWEATRDCVDRQRNTPDSALAFPLVWAQVLATLAASALASPMSYLYPVRLEQAHRDLQVADPAAGSFPATLSPMTRRYTEDR